MNINYHGHKDGEYLTIKGNYSSAIKVYLEILKTNPNDFRALNNLAFLYLKLNKAATSIQYYLRAIEINRDEVALNGLASVYLLNKNYHDAQKIYLEVLQKSPSNLNAILNIANLYFVLKKYKLSKKYYLKFYQYEKFNNIFYRSIVRINTELGLFSDTLIYLKTAIRQQPNNLHLKFLYLNYFPKIHNSKNDKKRLIRRFELILDKLISTKDKYIINANDIIEIFTTSTNFYLAYCRDVNKNINQKYFELITFFSKKIYTKSNIEKSTSQPKTIAIISSYLYDHTVGRLFQNLIINICKNFETTIYHLGKKEDYITRKLQKNSFSFIKNFNPGQIIDSLKNKNFDIIFFPEVGMCPTTQFLASIRFAKYQIVSWGHPITTGSNCIDYFISSELMERSTNTNSYTEKIIELSDIGVDVDPKIFPSNNKLISNRIRNKILNLQSLFKILPEDDVFYFKLLKIIPNLQFYFIKDKSDIINNKFFSRLKIGFDKYFKNTITFDQFFFFVNRTTRVNFIANMHNYDLVLDTFEWSGGNTSLEALLQNVPVVTVPSQTMRSRHTAAFLAHIGMDNLIAENQSELINLIKELMLDDNFYQTIIEKLRKTKENLYLSKSKDSFISFLKNLGK